MAGNELPDTSGKRALVGLADLQAKAAKHAAQAVLDIPQFGLQQLAGRQNGTGLLRRDRLAVHRPEPAETHELGNPAGIVAVRLHRHRLEGVANVPRLQKLNRKACIPHRRVQPLGQRTRLKSNPLARQPQRSEPGDQSFRLAQKLCLAQNLARSIDKTDARAFQRHVDSCIVVHGRPLMMLGAGLPDSVEHHQFEGRPPSNQQAAPIYAISFLRDLSG